MDVYFDLANLQSFISQRKHQKYEDCLRALKRQLNTKFNFTKEALKSDEMLLAWFKNLTENVSTTTNEFLENPFPQRPIENDCYNEFNTEQLSSVYLLDDESTQGNIEKGALLFGVVGDELKILSQLFFDNDDYKFDKRLIIGSDNLKSWNDLEKYQFPLNEIIISDPYILTNKDLLKANLCKILETFTINCRCHINIIIYTEKFKNDLEYNDVREDITNVIKKNTNTSSSITIIKYFNQRGQKVTAAEHDRTILTNYTRYYSGDTFNYWKPDGTKITNGRELNFSSFGDSETHNNTKQLIVDIQSYSDNYNLEIEGDKKSNFLNFPD